MQLDHTLQSILRKEAPEAIFKLGQASSEYQYDTVFHKPEPVTNDHAYLLLLVIATDKKDCINIQSRLQNELAGIAHVTCWCVPLTRFNAQLQEGNYFACTTCQSGCLYMSEDAEIIDPSPIAPLQVQAVWYHRAMEFYAGAELYSIHRQYALAAFHLHQCAEQCLTCMIYHACGYRPATHNLLLLFRYACWFVPGLHRLFPDTREGQLQLLQRSYTESRYTSGYCIKGEEIEQLKQKVQQLTGMAKTALTVAPGFVEV